jgi:uncharacterized LabA/DUF88 family protein
MDNNTKLAVLIDADNAQASIIHELLAEVSRYGTASVKRIYGDWTTDRLKGWKAVLNKMAIQPIQQFAYTSGKNATDSSLIIDAMDLLHTGHLNGFCLVSSDSDFTRLATRIREAGLVVYGFGEKKTPQPFVAACDKFVYTEILQSHQEPASARMPPKAQEPAGLKKDDGKSAAKISENVKLEQMIRTAVMATASDDGWVTLGQVGTMLLKNNPSFDPRNYGYQKLGELAHNQKYLELKKIPSGKGTPSVHIHIRLKSTTASQSRHFKT